MTKHSPDVQLCSDTYQTIISGKDDETPAWVFAPHERVVVLAWQAAGIIENGGFEYLFGNDLPGDPDFSLTEDAFETIGATEAACAVHAARGLFGGGQPSGDVDLRRQQLEQLGSVSFDALNRQFWSDNSVTARLAAFIRKHFASAL